MLTHSLFLRNDVESPETMASGSAFTTGDILQKLPELSRDLLYQWVARGYVTPVEVPTGTKGYKRKIYSAADLVKIQLIWKYYQQGFPPRLACAKAEEFLAQPCALQLSVDKTTSQLSLSLNQTFEVVATVEAYKVESCQVSLSFDEGYLSLISGDADQRFQVPGDDALFYGEMPVRWRFRATQATGAAPTFIHVTGRSGEVVSAASVAVEVR